MKIHIFLPLLLAIYLCSTGGYGWLWSSGGSSIAAIREKIASTAENKVGSTHWCFKCPSGHGRNTDKCNYFIYDVGRAAGAKMPTRSFWRGPIGAGVGGWGTAPSLSYWTRVSSPQRGDIVAAHKNNVYHVGIYVAYRTTVSANSKDVGRNSWPYGSYRYSGIVFWRYNG